MRGIVCMQFIQTQNVLARLFLRKQPANVAVVEYEADYSMATSPAVSLSNVSKQFVSCVQASGSPKTQQANAKTVLNNVSLMVGHGEVVVLLGASGCGKSTLLRLVNGLEKPDNGTVDVLGTSLSKPPPGFSWERFRSDVGIVFQQFNLFPHMTVLDNVSLGPRVVRKYTRGAANAMAMAQLEAVGLAEKAHAYPATLSGGEKQRVAIARALAMNPKILLLDEPTSALDPVMTYEVLSTIEKLAGQGVTMLIVTHEVEFAKKVADRIVFLHDGEIISDSRPEAFSPIFNVHPAIKHYLSGVHFQAPEDTEAEAMTSALE
jgi:ABC-type polar amino acid transport system ATPase subunit